jgi:hypothetical protein
MVRGFEVNMRIRLPLALAAAGLLASPARGEVVQASSTTVTTPAQLYRAGELRAATPVFELISVSASDMKTSVAEFEAVLSAWGSVDAGTIRFWQNGGSASSRAIGDVDIGYLKANLANQRVSVRLGRQVVVEGTSRMLHLDGAQLVAILPSGFGVSAWGGAPVAPRFDARGGDYATNATRASVAYGGRASWAYGALVDVGISAALADDGGEVSRRDLGADLRVVPLHGYELRASGFYALGEQRLGQGEVAVSGQVRRDLNVYLDYQRIAPDLFLPRNSILAVFVADKRDDAGGGLIWTPARAVSVDADYHLLKASDGNGYRARLKGTGSPWGQGRAGAELQLLEIPGNGYLLARIFGARAWGDLSGTLDVYLYRYDKKVNGQEQSMGAAATGGWQLAPAWKVLLAVSGGADPYYQSRFDVMAKLQWTQPFTREVR